MAQMQPIPSAMAVLVDAVPAPGRSQEEIVSLFGRLDGIEISIRSDNHDLDGTYNFASQAFQQSSTLMNPFGIVTATRGAFPIKSTAEGNPTIATLCVAGRASPPLPRRLKSFASRAHVAPQKAPCACLFAPRLPHVSHVSARSAASSLPRQATAALGLRLRPLMVL